MAMEQVSSSAAAFPNPLALAPGTQSSDWGKNKYNRQGLFQDLGIFDHVIAIIEGPIKKEYWRNLGQNKGFKELRSTDTVDATTGETESSDKGLWEYAFDTLINGAVLAGVTIESATFLCAQPRAAAVYFRSAP